VFFFFTLNKFVRLEQTSEKLWIPAHVVLLISTHQCRVSVSVQGQERLSHIDAMYSWFTLLLRLHGYIHFSYLYMRSRLFG